jgi:hypothetical protein
MSTKNEPQASSSSPRLSLRRERVRVLGVRSGLQTGILQCPNGSCVSSIGVPPSHISCEVSFIVG